MTRGKTYEPRESTFFLLIKDHKTKTDGVWPIRPIASVHGSTMDRLDQLLEPLVSTLAKSLTFCIASSENCIAQLKLLNQFCSSNGQKAANLCVASLDVKSLYPSIPRTAATCHFMRLYRKNLESLGSCWHTPEAMKYVFHGLTLLTNNCEIAFCGQSYKQIKGLAMGARHAPPLANIYMDWIEKQALSIWESKSSSPNYAEIVAYMRYMDDVLIFMICEPHNRASVWGHLLDVFNSIRREIQFTIEIPESTPSGSQTIAFLDIEVQIGNQGCEWQWFRKACHSGNELRWDSAVSETTKINTLSNDLKRSLKLCCNVSRGLSCIANRIASYRNSGYPDQVLQRSADAAIMSVYGTNEIVIKPVFDARMTVRVPFVNDAVFGMIKTLLFDEFKVNAVPYYSNALGKKPAAKQNNWFCEQTLKCGVCSVLDDCCVGLCVRSCLVYKATCEICSKFYVGKTARPLSERTKEHIRSIKSLNTRTALGAHMAGVHRKEPGGFTWHILKVCNDVIHLSFWEDFYIKHLRAPINHEFNVSRGLLRGQA
jgi:hypothetical protein